MPRARRPTGHSFYTTSSARGNVLREIRGWLMVRSAGASRGFPEREAGPGRGPGTNDGYAGRTSRADTRVHPYIERADGIGTAGSDTVYWMGRLSRRGGRREPALFSNHADPSSAPATRAVPHGPGTFCRFSLLRRGAIRDPAGAARGTEGSVGASVCGGCALVEGKGCLP